VTDIDSANQTQVDIKRKPDWAPSSTGQRMLRAVSPGNISLVYLYVLGFVLFAIYIPDLWLNSVTQLTVLNVAFAVPAMLAVGLLLPLLAGVFDLSIGATMSAASVTVSTLMVHDHWSAWAAIVVVLAGAAVVGACNGVLVAVVGIDSFIATLGTSSIIGAYAIWRSNNVQVTGLPPGFQQFGTRNLGGGVQLQVLYLAALSLIVWYLVEHTAAGRHLQATGENRDAARLSGIPVRRYIVVSLVCSATVAAFAGIVDTCLVGAGQANLGDPFLLSGFAAAFLGATQFKRRFNVVGTLVAVWALSSGVEGVTLAFSSYAWMNSLFFGLALIVAVGLGRVIELNNGRVAISRRRAVTALAEQGPGTQPADPSS
jgi:ribose transport system permease protein